MGTVQKSVRLPEDLVGTVRAWAGEQGAAFSEVLRELAALPGHRLWGRPLRPAGKDCRHRHHRRLKTLVGCGRPWATMRPGSSSAMRPGRPSGCGPGIPVWSPDPTVEDCGERPRSWGGGAGAGCPGGPLPGDPEPAYGRVLPGGPAPCRRAGGAPHRWRIAQAAGRAHQPGQDAATSAASAPLLEVAGKPSAGPAAEDEL